MAKDHWSISGNKLGLTLGILLALIHLVWAIMVKIDVAAKFLDWVMGLHFIQMPFGIAPFSIGNAVFLIIVAFIAGYVLGWVFAFVWHCVEHKMH